jgi:hypothetical protein
VLATLYPVGDRLITEARVAVPRVDGWQVAFAREGINIRGAHTEDSGHIVSKAAERREVTLRAGQRAAARAILRRLSS